MLYTLLWFLMRWMARVQHRRVHVQGLDQVPQDKPVLLAVNHTNAFWDAMLTAAALPRAHRVRFLTRGDVFKNPGAAAVLKNIGLFPVYRFRDGYASLKGNTATFRASIDGLKANGTVLIFPEGQCQPIPQLQSLMKGAARLAAQALDAGVEELLVVPVALTFEEHGRFRADVGIRFGKGQLARRMMNVEPEQSSPLGPKEIKGFTQNLHRLMLAQTLHLEDLHQVAALAEAGNASAQRDGWQDSDGSWMEDRRQKAAAFNANPDAAVPFMEARQARRSLPLEQGQLPNWVGPSSPRLRMPELPAHRLPAEWPAQPPPKRLQRLVAMLPLLPFAALARPIHALALAIAHGIIRSKVRDPQFIDSLRAVLGMAFFGLISVLLCALGCAVFARTGETNLAWGIWGLLPLLYWGSLWSLRLEERWVEWRRWRKS